jgi:hypothetical protein
MHDSRETEITKIYRRKTRFWNTRTHGIPVLHQRVLERAKNRQNGATPPYHSWIPDPDHEVEPWVRFKDLDRPAANTDIATSATTPPQCREPGYFAT